MNLKERIAYYQNWRNQECPPKVLREEENFSVEFFSACHLINLPHKESLEFYPDVAYEKNKILFLDIESVGLHFSPQNWPFLIGLAFFKDSYLETIQIFLKSPHKERKNLEFLEKIWQGYEILITYNGASFDIPLLKTRYHLYRKNFPEKKLEHIDLYRILRQIYPQKPRRLKDAEKKILHWERGEDIDGSEVGQAYFEFQKFEDYKKICVVMRHNLFDLLSLAKLSLKLDEAIQDIKKGNPNLFFKMQRIKNANLEFREKAFSLSLEKESVDYYILAKSYEENRDYRKAALYYLKALRLGEIKVLENLLKNLWRLKKYWLTQKIAQLYLTKTEVSIQRKLINFQKKAEKKLKEKEILLFKNEYC